MGNINMANMCTGSNYQVIIIGAGVSGLAASQTLTKRGISHIILESRDRIGGRVFAYQFNGETLQLGANYVHYPKEDGHVIAALMKRLGVGHYSANYDSQQFWLEGGKILSESQMEKVYLIYDKIIKNIQETATSLNQDTSLGQLAAKYLQNLTDLTEGQRNAIIWLIQQYANVEGGQIHSISAKESEFKSMRQDIIPLPGYSKLLQLFVAEFKPTILYNQRVIKIDYSDQIITVYSQNAVYKAKKVISSLPLGVLQAKKVKFQPELPLDYRKAINAIGVSLFNKLLVSFQQPFWLNRQGWLHFVSKGGKSKYPDILIVNKTILCVQMSLKTSQRLSYISDQQVIEDFCAFLKDYLPQNKIKVKDYKLTRWHLDQHSLGCFSYAKVGGSTQERITLSKPINDALWFIGEHTSFEAYATVRGAFESGILAANQVINSLKK